MMNMMGESLSGKETYLEDGRKAFLYEDVELAIMDFRDNINTLNLRYNTKKQILEMIKESFEDAI